MRGSGCGYCGGCGDCGGDGEGVSRIWSRGVIGDKDRVMSKKG